MLKLKSLESAHLILSEADDLEITVLDEVDDDFPTHTTILRWPGSAGESKLVLIIWLETLSGSVWSLVKRFNG